MNRETEKMAQEQERVAVDYRLGHTNMDGAVMKSPYYDLASNQKQAQPLRRPPVRQRIHEALYAAERANERLEVALRAKAVIDAHPEFADLLDALDQF